MVRQTTTSATCRADSGDCAGGKRNRYFRNKPMGAAEFRAEQQYFLERRWLINRTVHGWGVVAGYKLAGPRKPNEESKPVTIGEGLAFDRYGHELLLCASTALTEKNTFLASPLDAGQTRPFKDAAPGRYLLRAHYAERSFGDSFAASQCGCDGAEKSFICETVIFSVSHLCCDVKCPCAESECEHHCGCNDESCKCGGRGPHGCLCHWIADTTVSCERPSPWGCLWNGLRIDPRDGVPLACVTIQRTDDSCQPIVVSHIDDDCGPRRLVKNNDLLYELARGCDLTRIERISWGAWHRHSDPMKWTEFRDFIGKGPAHEEEECDSVVTRFTVRFTGPVLKNTVTADCFALKFIVSHEDTGWSGSRTAGMFDPIKADPSDGDPPDTTREVTLVVDRLWHNEAKSLASKFRNEGAIVEIDVYGDFILDCNGQSVDGNAKGFALRDWGDGKAPLPSGNGTPGGTFLSVFRIGPKTPKPALNIEE